MSKIDIRETMLAPLISLTIGGGIASIAALLLFGELKSDASLLLMQLLFNILMAVVAWMAASGWKTAGMTDAPRVLGLRPFKLHDVMRGFVLLVFYYGAIALFTILVFEPKQENIGQTLGIQNENLLVVVLAVAAIVLVAPFAEELLFRGILFQGLRNYLSFWPAALLSGGFFGLIHFSTGPTTVIPLALLGVLLAWLFEKSKSLWPAIIIHSLNNALATVNMF